MSKRTLALGGAAAAVAACLGVSPAAAAEGDATITVIHGVALPAAATVDVWAGENVLLDDFSFKDIKTAMVPAGTYDLYVVLFGAAPGQTSVPVPTFLWNLDGSAEGNLTVTPASTPATAGTPVTLTAAWSGLTAGRRYLGRIDYIDGTTSAGGTFVRVHA